MSEYVFKKEKCIDGFNNRNRGLTERREVDVI